MAEKNEKLTAAAVQMSPVFLNKDETIGKVRSLIEEARENRADLIVFPEATIPTYPYWPKDIGSGAERKLILDAFTELYKNSVEIPSKDTDKLCESARKSGAYVIIGVNERDGGTLYNTILYIDKNGSIMGKHRKLMSIDSEKCIWGMGTAEDLRVFDTELGRIGGFFCYEHHLTLAKYAMYTKGEQIHAGLWAGHGFVKPTMDFASRQYAFEGQVFVIAASLYINEDMVPDSFPLKKYTKWDFPGGSGIINPRGEYIAGPLYDKEGILYAQIDLDMIIRAKAVIDAVGHFSRPDIVRLEFRGENNPSGEYKEIRKTINDLSERYEKLEARIEEILKALPRTTGG
ncbi:MAG TPA: carbon-nitrogen hydrolase family protein [Thermodesulfobacteriota bacterium]|nr:carbon-nitrogen hydrolase family protein [Thermodesulfobacteriota bacterium]